MKDSFLSLIFLHILPLFLLMLPPSHPLPLPLPDSHVLLSPKSRLSLPKANSRFMNRKGGKGLQDCLSLNHLA